MPDNPLISYPNRAAGATLANGSFEPTLPRSFLQERSPGQRARTTDATTSSTQVEADLGADYPLRVLALFGHNLSLSAQYRMRLGSGGGIYDSGWVNVYRNIYPAGATLLGESVGGGTVTQDQWSSGKRLPIIEVLSSHTTARIVSLEIDDTGNADGYVDMGLLWASPVMTFSDGRMLQGASFDLPDPSTRRTTDGGPFHFDVRQGRKQWGFDLGMITATEHKVEVMEMKRRIGQHGQVVVVPNYTDLLSRYEESFVGVRDGSRAPDVLADWLYRNPLAFVEEL